MSSSRDEYSRRTADVEQMLDAYHDAASRADAPEYFGYFSPDAYFIGTDATERWTIDQFKQYVLPFMSKGQGWAYRPQQRHVTFLLANDHNPQVAWFDEILQSDRFGVVRSSGVVIREDHRWKIAQYHLTVPVPNDLMDQVVAMIRADESPSAAGSE